MNVSNILTIIMSITTIFVSPRILCRIKIGVFGSTFISVNFSKWPNLFSLFTAFVPFIWQVYSFFTSSPLVSLALWSNTTRSPKNNNHQVYLFRRCLILFQSISLVIKARYFHSKETLFLDSQLTFIYSRCSHNILLCLRDYFKFICLMLMCLCDLYESYVYTLQLALASS